MTGGGSQKLPEHNLPKNYVSIITQDFSLGPAFNEPILRKLFVEKGLSKWEIARIIGWSATSVHKAIVHLNLKRPQRPRSIKFGERLAFSRIVPHKREQAIIKMMVRLRKSGLPYQAIANQLNDRGIAPKIKGRWHVNSVKLVLSREKISKLKGGNNEKRT